MLVNISKNVGQHFKKNVSQHFLCFELLNRSSLVGIHWILLKKLGSDEIYSFIV
jgi:hypothetical protein